MKALQVVGLVVLILGILGIVFGEFTYTKETHDADLGPIELEFKDKETVNVPTWAGVTAIVVGGALLFFGRRSR